jgi:hypothetical protein
MANTARLAAVIGELETELAETEERAEKIRRLIEAARDVLPRDAQPATTSIEPETLGVNGKGRPPLKTAILTFLRQGGTDGINLAALTEALWQRGWVGTTKEGKPSRESVRGALLDLRRQGLVSGKADGDTSWEPTLWRLNRSTAPIRTSDYLGTGNDPVVLTPRSG